MYIDLFTCALLVWAIYSGWRNGFLKEVFSTLGIIAGLAVAAALYFYLADDYFKIEGTDTNQLLNIGAFLILWIVVPLSMGLVANILTAALKGMRLGYPNSILGVVFSVAKFALLLSCVLNVMDYLHILDKKMVDDSKCYETAIKILPFAKDEAIDLVKKSDFPFQAGDTIWVKK